MYGQWSEDGEFNPFDGEPDDDPLSAAELPCVNCGAMVVARGYPYLYCSERCGEEASAVRYARRVYRDGRILDPLVAEAVKTQIGLVLGGGYSESERRLSQQQRAAAMERDRSRCRVCGAPASEIDHINEDLALVARDINNPDNLQALCGACHREKTRSGFRPIGPEHREHADELNARIDALEPLRECDDEQNWDRLRKQHSAERSALVKSLAD